MPLTPSPRLPDHLRYLVIEGVIGAGKTTLAKLLAKRFNAQLVLEQFEENPFLERFYSDQERWAFHTQLTFLASRFRQQKQLATRDLFHDLTIADYAFDKDRIFADVTLHGDERTLYDTLYTIMEPATPVPDLVVFLQASTDRLLENIAQRGRSYEQAMERSYLDALSEAYTYYFFRYTKSPLLIINTTHIDFVANPHELDELVHQITSVRNQGLTYFSPTRPSGHAPFTEQRPDASARKDEPNRYR
ncbi:MAG: deoxynucleoside kinase [Bacteroidota bacterium]